MWGQPYELPAVRKLFLPDPGHVLLDVDLSGADAQVVAWDANEPALKHAFKNGLNVHNYNGKRIWGEAYDPKKRRRKLSWRDECKRGVHGTNYLLGVMTFIATLGWSKAEVVEFQRTWFRLNPNIKVWHNRIAHDLASKQKTIKNQFGYRIIYMDRIEQLLPEAVAWIPQSTIATVCSRGAVRVDQCLPWVDILLQVHDSLVLQIPYHRLEPASLEALRDHLTNEVPYPNDPLIVPWGLKLSLKSWGDLREAAWDNPDAGLDLGRVNSEPRPFLVYQPDQDKEREAPYLVRMESSSSEARRDEPRTIPSPMSTTAT